MTTKAWPSQAYLDALRPEIGWAVETAILASYSTDVSSIGAALLALAGRDDDRGSGSCSDLAEAVEELRGRVRIIIQRGRLAKPAQVPPIAGIFDQFLAEVPFDEAEQSWHPKLAIVCFSHPDLGKAWRLWLGSQNLTAAENLDFGLLLLGSSGAHAKGTEIDGIKTMAERLAKFARLPNIGTAPFGRDVGQIRWLSPTGFKVLSIGLTSGRSDGMLPKPPAHIEELFIISPFIDGTTVSAVGGWGEEGTRRSILSTRAELSKLGAQTGQPLRAFAGRILAFDAPILDDVEAGVPGSDTVVPSIVEPGAEHMAPLGLHAKIIAVRTKRKLHLWIGSANATNRAWSGRNVEIIAEIEADPDHQAGLDDLLGHGIPLSEEDLARETKDNEDAIHDRLDNARKYVAAQFSGVLTHEGDMFVLEAKASPHPPDTAILLDAGLATGSVRPWPRGSAKLDLGFQPVSLQTELVQFRLSVDSRECRWMQRVRANPPLDEDRDRAALARHLGPKAFLEWLRSLLRSNTTVEDEGEPWDSAGGSREKAKTMRIDFESITLEDMLSCWARDSKAFERADKRIQSFLDLIIAENATLNTEELIGLQELKTIWTMLKSQLLEQP